MRDQKAGLRPEDLSFTINDEHMPSHFLRDDISVGENRHLIFMSETMETLLSTALVWYVDGTFRVIKKPFIQLFIIHVGIHKARLTIVYILYII